MALKTFTCTVCEKEFKAGQWDCAPGIGHVIQAKRYFMDDAPTVPEWRDGKPYINKGISQTQILMPETQIREGENITRIPGDTITFVRGLFETTNPKIQFFLDNKPGLCNEERWKEVYLNDDEKIALQRLDLVAREQRLQERENDLLASVKARK